MDYATLIAGKSTAGSLMNWVSRDNLPSPTIVLEAEQLIFDRLRVREMLVVATGTLTIGSEVLTLPTRYLATRLFMFTGIYKKKLRRGLIEDVLLAMDYDSTNAQVSDEPSWYSTNATQYVFDRPADLAYPYKILHHARPVPLSTASTNFLTDTKPALLRAMCLAMAAEWAKDDEEKAHWLAVAGEHIDAANAENDRELQDLDMRVVAQ